MQLQRARGLECHVTCRPWRTSSGHRLDMIGSSIWLWNGTATATLRPSGQRRWLRTGSPRTPPPSTASQSTAGEDPAPSWTESGAEDARCARARVCVCVEGALREGGHSLYTPLYSFYPYFEYAVCMRLCVWRQGGWPIAIRGRTIAKCQSCDYKAPSVQ